MITDQQPGIAWKRYIHKKKEDKISTEEESLSRRPNHISKRFFFTTPKPIEACAHVGYTLHLLALRVPLVALDTLAGGTSSGTRVSLSTTLSVQLNATAAATFVGFDISKKQRTRLIVCGLAGGVVLVVRRPVVGIGGFRMNELTLS